MSIENYEKFLTSFNEDIELIFNHQREFISCQEGCSLCCERGDYPLSELEYKYMMVGFNKLNDDIKEIIKKNIEETKKGDRESYVCPFLINKSCSIYQYRPIICRTFGVLIEDSKGELHYPFCATLGKSYSAVYDKEKNSLSSELYYKGNYVSYPRFFNLNNKTIMNSPLAKELNLEFGALKKMIDFLEQE